MKIVQLKAENVKRLQAVEINPDGSMVVIGGKNGQGKSSILDSVIYALTGTRSIPDEPVRKGEEEAEIRVEMDGDPPLIVRRKIKADGKSTLTVTEVSDRGIESKVRKPQELLDKIVGKLAFDPLAFTRETPKNQVDILREVVGCDVSDLDAKVEELMEERKHVKRELSQVESQIAGIPEVKDAPDKESSVSELIEERDRVSKLIDVEGDAREALESARNDLDILEDELSELLAKIDRAKKTVKEKEKLQTEAEAATAELPEDALEDLNNRIRNCEDTNRKVRQKQARDKMKAEANEKARSALSLTAQIDDLRKQKIDRMAAVDWPVDGLAFTDDGIEFNGLPFEQCSSAEQLKIAAAIGLAQKPELSILFIREGSLLDEESLKTVAELAGKYGAQVWIERVSEGAECSVVIEDGMVKA